MSHRNEESGGGDHSHMNGHVELKRSCRVRKSQFEHLNQSLLFDQLVNRYLAVTLLALFFCILFFYIGSQNYFLYLRQV